MKNYHTQEIPHVSSVELRVLNLNRSIEFYTKTIDLSSATPKNYILKILLNATYGLINDKFSFLRDRQITLSICINGQLLLSMLFEKLLTIPNPVV